MMYSSDVNPRIYVAATLKGGGLRDDDLTWAFAKIIQKKTLESKQKCPQSAEELIKSLDITGPLQHI